MEKKLNLQINKIEMAKGYEEMGDINLTISIEDFHLEDEGEKISYEMVAKES